MAIFSEIGGIPSNILLDAYNRPMVNFMMEKLREFVWAILGFFFLFGIIIFWNLLLAFFQSNPWYVNIAIFVGIGTIGERIERWRTLNRLKQEARENGVE